MTTKKKKGIIGMKNGKKIFEKQTQSTIKDFDNCFLFQIIIKLEKIKLSKCIIFPDLFHEFLLLIVQFISI